MGNSSFKFDAKALDKAIKREAKRAVSESEFDYTCPKCGSPMKVKVGETRICPSCGFGVTAELGQSL